jgi:hypothetical protein
MVAPKIGLSSNRCFVRGRISVGKPLINCLRGKRKAPNSGGMELGAALLRARRREGLRRSERLPVGENGGTADSVWHTLV